MLMNKKRNTDEVSEADEQCTEYDYASVDGSYKNICVIAYCIA